MKGVTKLIIILALSTTISTISAAEIHDAARDGDLDLVVRLLDEDPSLLDTTDDDGMTPLNRAALSGRSDIAAELIRRGANINTGDVDNSQPLHCAAISGDTATAALLLSRGVNINVRDDNNLTPLHFASSYRQLPMVGFLLEHGADGDVQTSQGLAPISYAAFSNNLELAELLIEHGADINHSMEDGSTPLHNAAYRGASEVFNYLVEHGADIHATDNEGASVLHAALGPNSYDIAKKLLELGLDANIRTDANATPLHYLGWHGTVETAELLLEHGADINTRNDNGWTPLTFAAHHNFELTQFYLSRGADVNPDMPNDTVDGRCRVSGITPLYGAVRSDSLNTVMLLVEDGADLNIPDDNGVTPLHLAVGKGNNEIARYLISKGAALSKEDRYERTELHTASVMGMHDLANTLVDAGSDVSAQDRFGQTPLDYAFSHGFSHVAELLKNNGAAINKKKNLANTTELLKKQLNEKEAVIWYLEHSGWAIKTKNHFLVFDYFLHGDRTTPDGASLASGYVLPEALKDQYMTVFVTHHHGDHFNPAIFSWQETHQDITYVLGFRPRDIEHDQYTFTGPRTEHSIDGMNISTIKSNDAGVGFIIEVDGLVIFHAGDHANGYVDMSGEYPVEIDYVAAKDLDIDLAFFGITGCSLGDPVSVKAGVRYAIEKLSPTALFPQHGGMATYRYQEFADEVADKNYPTRIVCAVDWGDRFFFTNGSVARK
ncbi:MAG: ankyrin repeat domain-containing protein [candidate division WOR-3 bacterium]|nr:MAG: ankyrin repeat domain-containing protein [candidate division WOR-3 bacterium]